MNKYIFIIITVLLFSCSESTNNHDNIKGEDNIKSKTKKEFSIKDKNEKTNNSFETDSLKTEEKTINTNPLPSWNNTKVKSKIISYVNAVTDKNCKAYIPESDRIATFDNDGTLWAEQPTYFQIEFVLDRIKELEKEHPEWGKDKLIQTAVNHDLDKLRKKYGVKGLGKLMSITQSGMTTDEFESIVQNWIKTARHHSTNKLYKNMVYKPMVELINYLHENKFKVYIVSSGGTDFIRVFAKQLYNIDKEYVIGSYQKLEYTYIDNKPSLKKLPKIMYVSDDKGKVVSIYQIIGKKPVLAVGNSDRDIPMLEWSKSCKYNNLQIIVHHTDSVREWAYDKNTRIGILEKGLNEALDKNWLVVDMKKDWKNIFIK